MPEKTKPTVEINESDWRYSLVRIVYPNVPIKGLKTIISIPSWEINLIMERIEKSIKKNEELGFLEELKKELGLENKNEEFERIVKYIKEIILVNEILKKERIKDAVVSNKNYDLVKKLKKTKVFKQILLSI